MRMKNQDLVVLLIIAFGFGFLFSWALFFKPIVYDKQASIEWPAWVQAFGSLLALIVAIVVPHLVYAKERSERDRRAVLEDNERQTILRLRAKSLAISFLPVARDFAESLQGLWAQFHDPDIDEYSGISTKNLVRSMESLLPHTGTIHELGVAGELVLDSIAKAEQFLRLLSDWEFYETHTFNGVIDDPERGIYEKFDAPAELLPVLRASTDKVDGALRLVDDLFR